MVYGLDVLTAYVIMTVYVILTANASSRGISKLNNVLEVVVVSQWRRQEGCLTCIASTIDRDPMKRLKIYILAVREGQGFNLIVGLTFLFIIYSSIIPNGSLCSQSRTLYNP